MIRLDPHHSVWPASQQGVPSVCCCLTPHWLLNEGLRGGSQGGVAVGGAARWWWWGFCQKEDGGGVYGASLPPSAPSFRLLPQLQACILGQLLIHSTVQHNNKQRPQRAGQQSGTGPPGHQPARLQGRRQESAADSPPTLQEVSDVSRTLLSSSCSFLFLPSDPLIQLLFIHTLLSPPSPPQPLPAFTCLSETNSQLSQPPLQQVQPAVKSRLAAESVEEQQLPLSSPTLIHITQ